MQLPIFNRLQATCSSAFIGREHCAGRKQRFFYAKLLFIQYEARLHARAVDALHENSLDVRGF